MDTAAPVAQNASEKPNTSNHTDGDHDSGVDENTQRKDGPTTNGDFTSPTKSPSKIPAPKKLSTLPSPTKSVKGSPKTPEAPPTADKKKVPMNKIQVGAAPSPNLKTVKSKIGSLQNATHKPGGGNVKIEHRKLDWKAEPRIAAKNDAYQPGGGDKKIPQVKLKWEAKPKVGSLDNATHKPGGGEKKIESVKLDFKDKAKPKVGSKDNIKHQPGGGNVKTPSQDGSQDGNPGDIEDQKLDVKAQSKIGSLDNVKHKPGGGDRKIFDDKDYLRQMSGSTSRAASEGIPSGTQDGWSSASTSRRTSQDRQTKDRRYRSESRLGLRTPEPRMGISPKEERHDHCSIWEKHDREVKALAQEEGLPSVLQVKVISKSEESIVENTGEDKDLNSNNPSRAPVATDESHKPKLDKGDQMSKQPKSEELVIPKEEKDSLQERLNDKPKNVPEPIKIEGKGLQQEILNEKTNNVPEPIKIEGKGLQQEVLNEKTNNIPESIKIEGKDLQQEILTETPNTVPEPMKIESKPQKEVENSKTTPSSDSNFSKTTEQENLNKMVGLEMVTQDTKQKEQNQNVPKKPESKEDLVREIKEIDSKELVNEKSGSSNLSNNINNKSNQPNQETACSNFKSPINEPKG